jgi:cytoskeletal protein CcmA (bactofilin family)
MFNTKSKSMNEKTTTSGTGTTLIGAGTTLKGDINSNCDLRIDGTIIGNVSSKSKIVIGASGVIEGDLEGNQADIVGKVSGNIRVKDLLQLRGDCNIKGNVYAGKLQIEPTSTFNGQCHMGTAAATTLSKAVNVVEMNKSNESQAIAK